MEHRYAFVASFGRTSCYIGMDSTTLLLFDGVLIHNKNFLPLNEAGVDIVDKDGNKLVHLRSLGHAMLAYCDSWYNM